MAGKVILEATRGELAGKRFEFTENIPRLYIGRNPDCGIVVPESTASRYHCMLEILPPTVKLQDFGSLNGTYLDGELIGRRERMQSPEEAQSAQHGVYELRDGSVLGLGRSCEFVVHTEGVELCAECGGRLPKVIGDGDATMPEGAQSPALLRDEYGKRICAACYAKQLRRCREKKDAGTEKSALRVCRSCGKGFRPVSPDNNLCPACMGDRGRILDGVLGDLREKLQQPRTDGRASLLEGFEQLRCLGRGGFGEVWLVRRCGDGKEYALKTMRPEVAVDEESKRIFLRESDIARQLFHPNIVQVEDVGCANGVFYILMELCEGGDVNQLLDRKGGRLSPELATRIILQCLTGLNYLHNAELTATLADGTARRIRGVVHRDFKPGNIFLSSRSGNAICKIADYGLTKAFDTAGLSGYTATGTILGTKAYMSRVQAINWKYAGPDVDVWSAAASYYHMLTGTTPKDFSARRSDVDVIVSGTVRPISTFNKEIPPRMAEVIDHALIDNPRIGFDTAAEFRAALVSALPPEIREYCEDIL